MLAFASNAPLALPGPRRLPGRRHAGRSAPALLWWRAHAAEHPRTMPTPALRPATDPARTQRDERLAALLDAAARGNSAAFEQFFDATAGYARALARRMLSGADVDDLLADAFFEAWRKAARFDAQRGSAVTWLLQIVRSRALDLLRQQALQPAAAAAPALADEPADPAADPAEQLWQQQAGTCLHEALQCLNPAERWVLGLAYFRDLSHSEIASATGLPLGTVKSHVQRAQTRLRAALTAPTQGRPA
jgi:RNA polymerase sigma-70 factor (ECF subfamily)